MNWQAYEDVTKYIYETLGRDFGVKVDCHGRNCKVKGKSEVPHQIDVLTSHTDGLHTYRTAVECKYWDKSIDKDIIMKVAAIVEDANLQKGVIVSKLGFTPDAISWAKYRNIGLVELREMREKDWEGRPQIVAVKSEVWRPSILRLIIVPAETMDDQQPIEQSPLDIMLTTATGAEMKLTELLTAFFAEVRSQEPWKPYGLTYLFKDGTISYTKLSIAHQIKGITLEGVLRVLPGPKFFPVDQIWLIMKNIFENTTHTISESGRIRKDE